MDIKILENLLQVTIDRRNVRNFSGSYERHFGQPFKGPIIPFGSLVEYHPITAKDQSRIHQFERKFYLDCSSDTLFTR